MKKIFTDIYKRNLWESLESCSGKGSELTRARILIDEIPKILKEYGICSVLDIPCGDFNWMKHINLTGVHYVGCDIVDEIINNNIMKYSKTNIEFKALDITTDSFDSYDLVICRDCLGHFSIKDIFLSISNIINSNSKYLLTTNFPEKNNSDIQTGNWHAVNLCKEPFNFPDPIYTLNEGCMIENGIYKDKSLSLWDINVLKDVLTYV